MSELENMSDADLFADDASADDLFADDADLFADDDLFSEGNSLQLVDISGLGGPVVDDRGGLTTNVDMAEQGEFVHAAVNAIESLDMPNSSMQVWQSGDVIHVAKTVSTHVDGSIELDGDFAPTSGGGHNVFASITITPQEDGGYQLAFKAQHDGSYDAMTADAVETNMTYDVTPEGDFENRAGQAKTHLEGGQSIRNLDHGNWSIEAAQTLEGRFASQLDVDAKEQMNQLRPASAVSEVTTELPAAPNAVSLSNLDFEKMLSNDGMGMDGATVAPPAMSPGM